MPSTLRPQPAHGLALIVAAALCLGPAQAEPARASSLSVSPVHVVLDGKSRSALVTLVNTGDEAMRLELSAFAWAQSPAGEMEISPTDDIVFFPPLLTLAPGEQRKVRVGSAVPPAAVERSYRLFVEQMPPLGPSTPHDGTRVRVLTRVGLPVFIRPPEPRVGGRVDSLTLRERRLAFELTNTGTVHFMAETVRITGEGAAGEPVLQGSLPGWYVLAGGRRVFDVEVPPDRCRAVKAVTVEVNTGRDVLSNRFELRPGGCLP